MKERLYTILGMIGSLFTPMLFFLAYRHLLHCGSVLPFSLATFALLPTFAVGLVYVMLKVCKHSVPGLTEPGVSHTSTIITGVMQGIYLCCSIYALSFPGMSPRRYFVLSTFFDMAFMLFLPCALLSRPFLSTQCVCAALSLLAYVLHDFLALDFGGSENTASATRFYQAGGWKAFVCLVSARFAFCFRGYLHKRMQIINHCAKKWLSTNQQLVSEQRTPLNKAYLDEGGKPCCRLVSIDSAVVAFAQHLRNVASIRKASAEEGKEPENISVENDDYMRYLLDTEAVTGKRRAKIVQSIIKNDVALTGNSLYHHMFYLRNKIFVNDMLAPHGTVGKKKEAFTHYKMCSISDKADNPNAVENRLKDSASKNLGTKALSDTVKDVLNEAQNLSSNVHLFTGFNDLHLTKLDLMFSLPTFDTVLFEFSSVQHCVMYYLVTVFPTTIGCTFMASLNGETMVLSEMEGYKMLFGSVSGIIVFAFFALLLAAVPFLDFHKVMAILPQQYHWLELCITMLWLSIEMGFIEYADKKNIETLSNVSLLLTVLAKALYISTATSSYYTHLHKSNVEAVKMALSKQFTTAHQLRSFTRRAHKVKQVLGPSMLNSVLIDALVAE